MDDSFYAGKIVPQDEAEFVYVAGGTDGPVVFEDYAYLRIGPAFVRPEDQLIRLPIKGVNVKSALIQRGTDKVIWEDWKTMDLEDNSCEAGDLTIGESKYFYRAVEAEETP